MQYHSGNNSVDQIVNKNAMRNNDRFLLFEFLSNILNSQNVSLNILRRKKSTATAEKKPLKDENANENGNSVQAILLDFASKTKTQPILSARWCGVHRNGCRPF